nr:hypothetical protein [Marinicella sp. W31]MDC2878422.1 hypothetical protein [Marinicella sp. W31]
MAQRSSPELTFLTGVSPSEVDRNAPLFSTLSDCVEAVSGKSRNSMRSTPAAISAILLVQKNIPAVGFGALCGDLTQNGFNDEWVDLDEFLDSIAATALFVATWESDNA